MSWHKQGVIRTHPTGRHSFWCPACNDIHQIVIAPGGWWWNGSYDKPTYKESISVRGTAKLTAAEHVDIMRGKPVEPRKTHCHSFVKDGRIQYLDDCTHDMAGSTVDLPAEGWDYEP